MAAAGAPAVNPIIQLCRKAHVRTTKGLLTLKVLNQKVGSLLSKFRPAGTYAESSQTVTFNIFPSRSYKDPVLQHLRLHIRLLKWIPRKIHLSRIREIIIAQRVVNGSYQYRWREFHCSKRIRQMLVLRKSGFIHIVQSVVWNDFLC